MISHCNSASKARLLRARHPVYGEKTCWFRKLLVIYVPRSCMIQCSSSYRHVYVDIKQPKCPVSNAFHSVDLFGEVTIWFMFGRIWYRLRHCWRKHETPTKKGSDTMKSNLVQLMKNDWYNPAASYQQWYIYIRIYTWHIIKMNLAWGWLSFNTAFCSAMYIQNDWKVGKSDSAKFGHRCHPLTKVRISTKGTGK